jgi:hypothetical protein
MRRNAGLTGLVVIRHDDQRRIGADVLGRRHHRHRRGGRIAAAAGDHRHPAARLDDRQFDHPAMLGGTERRHLAGGPARHQRIAALVNLPLNKFVKCVLGDTAIDKGRN